MVFSSYIFLAYFLPLALACYFVMPPRGKTITLTFFSLLFYGWWKADFLLLMIFSAVVDFFVGGAMGRTENPRRRVLLLLASLVTNLGLLGYFKYADFGISSLNVLLEEMGLEVLPLLKITLPVGISFYTFQSMSYTIDVFRRQVKPIRDFLNFFAYVSMFPQLVAGPIVRFRDVQDQLARRTHTLRKFGAGALLFQIGFTKKVLIADSVAPVADKVFAMSDPGFAETWLGVLAYTFQIYFDFSGYSDMAIGMGLMMGFVFPINFDSPYKSRSITEFWRRWHISLSTWLRDYLYIPLGGNRHGVGRMYFALLMTMLLGGLWHGAAWTYIAWGAYQGSWLVIERVSGKRTFYGKLPALGQVAVTFVLACVGWVFFRATSLTSALQLIGRMFGGSGLDLSLGFEVENSFWFFLVIAAVVAWGFRPSQQQVTRARWPVVVFVPLLFVLAVGHLLYQNYRPFLYFQF